MEDNSFNKPFESLTIPRKDLPKLSSRHYRIYQDRTNFIVVEANNAQEALQASGYKKAYRIEHDNMYRQNVISFESTIPKPAGNIPVDMTPPIAAAEPSMPVSPEQNETPTVE